MGFFNNLTLLGKLLFVLLLLGVLYGVAAVTGVADRLQAMGGDDGREGQERYAAVSGDCYRVGVMPWVGYAGGQLYNEGFEDSPYSRYRNDGICVDFISFDSRVAQIAAFKEGDLDLMWGTVAALAPESRDLPDDTRAIFQVNKSTGGDVMVANRPVRSASDLRGMKIATAVRNPSHTLTLFALESFGVPRSDVQIVEMADPVQALAAYKGRQVDAAALWTPDDVEAVETVPGTQRILSTRQTPNLIHDVMLARESTIREHAGDLATLYRGWMIGADEIERGLERGGKSDPAVQKAIQIMADGYQFPVEFFDETIENAYRTNHGDNLVFFGLSGETNAVTGQEVYDNGARLYRNAAVIRGAAKPWSEIADDRIVRAARDKSDLAAQRADAPASFDAATSEEIASAEALTSKDVAVEYAVGSAALTGEGRRMIDDEFAPQARLATTQRVRIVGHTDDTGAAAANLRLSSARAQSVADYLVARYGFDPDRFIIEGRGSREPVASNGTAAGRAQNRRTELQLLQ